MKWNGTERNESGLGIDTVCSGHTTGAGIHSRHIEIEVGGVRTEDGSSTGRATTRTSYTASVSNDGRTISTSGTGQDICSNGGLVNDSQRDLVSHSQVGLASGDVEPVLSQDLVGRWECIGLVSSGGADQECLGVQGGRRDSCSSVSKDGREDATSQ